MRKQQTNGAPRQMVRSATTLGDAFRTAGINLIKDVKDGYRPTEGQAATIGMIDTALENGSGSRKRPAWTVSKRPEKKKARK